MIASPNKRWPFNRIRPVKRPTSNQCHDLVVENSQSRSTIAFPGLFNQLDQAGNLGFWTGLYQPGKLIFRQVVFQILHHIEVLPPAIQNLKAGLLLVPAYFAIIKRYGVAQSWATPHQSFLFIVHETSNAKIPPLNIFNDLRFGILFEHLFRFGDILSRKFIIGKRTGKVFVIGPKVD